MRFLSLFSGIEAASVAWMPLGWKCVGVAEIDPFPCSVLKHHYPNVLNLGSVKTITEHNIKNLGQIDLVVGGFPCQDLSVAGKRKGLRNDDGTATRSGLFFDAMQIVQWARKYGGCRFLLIENVPGLLSSQKGRDFAEVVGQMAGSRFNVPPNGWENTGVCLGAQGLVEWCVLDAQWFGVAQRRRRVFALADFGNWHDRPPVLFERHSLSWDSPPSREKGEGITSVLEVGARTGKSTSDKRAGIGISDPGDPMFTLQSGKQHGIVAPTIPSRKTGGGGLGTDFDCDGGLVLSQGTCPTLRAGGNKTGGDRPPGTDVDTVESLIVMANGQPNSEIVNDGEPSLTCNHEAPIAFVQNSRDEVRLMGGDGKLSGALAAETGAKQQTYVATLALRGRGSDTNFKYGMDGTTANTLMTPNGGRGGIGVSAIQSGMQVRRLTPLECERLQGFPDGYTAIPWRGKPVENCPDGPRYKALGNSMAVPVMRWIGERIQLVDSII